jgi:hypothetical protein
VRLLDDATLEQIVGIVAADTGRNVVMSPLDPGVTNRSAKTDYGLDDPGFVAGIAVSDGEVVEVKIEQFATAADATAFHAPATLTKVRDSQPITSLEPPVADSVSFVCVCGASYVSFVRDNVRVKFLIEPAYTDTGAVVTKLARDLEAVLVST